MTIKKMVAWLKKADDAYYNSGKPIVSDSKYDERREKLLKKVKRKEGSKEELKEAKAYLKTTGAKVRKSKRNVKLPFFIASLHKLKSDDKDSVDKWLKKIKKVASDLDLKLSKEDKKFYKSTVAIVTSPKLDGVSLTLAYKDGKLVDAFTRGDGTKGQSKIEHAKVIESIPKVLKGREESLMEGYMFIRGELVAHKQRFNAYNKKHNRFKTILNAVSGWINSDTPDSFSKVLDFIAYDIRLENGKEIGSDTPPNALYMGAGKGASKHVTLNQLKTYGFSTYKDIPNCHEINSVSMSFSDTWFTRTKRILDNVNEEIFPYPVDGLVIEVADNYLRAALGMSGDNRPEYAKAFKYSAAESVNKEGQETKVRKIEVTVAKNGAQKPVIVFDTIDINGAKVSRATGNNFNYLVKKKIGVGSVVSVVKSGGIIPQATLVRKPKEKDDILPTSCPCGAKLVHTGSDSYCSKPQKCKYTQYALLVNAIKKMKLTGLGTKNIQALFDAGYYDLPSLIEAKEKHLKKIPRFGDSAITTIKKGIPEKIRNMSKAELMEISGVFTKPGLSLAFKVLNDLLDGNVSGERYALYKEKKSEYKQWEKRIKSCLRE